MTAPSRFIPGRPENICLDLVDITNNMSVEIALYKTSQTVAAKPVVTSPADMVARTTVVITPAGK